MFLNILISFLIVLVSVSSFAPSSIRQNSVSRLSMTRLLNMAIMKIPLSSQCTSSEIIDENQLCINNNSSGRRPLMGGNWKLNPRSVNAATTLASEVSHLFHLFPLSSD